MKLALELSVTTQLDENHLVEQQSHEVEWLGHVAGLLPDIGHGCVTICACVCIVGTKEMDDGFEFVALQGRFSCFLVLGSCGMALSKMLALPLHGRGKSSADAAPQHGH